MSRDRTPGAGRRPTGAASRRRSGREPRVAAIPDPVAGAARGAPSALAVVDGEIRITWVDLAARVADAAWLLREAGGRPPRPGGGGGRGPPRRGGGGGNR